MNEAALWNFIHKTISSDKKAVLLTVAESSNSSPGRQGFKMVASKDAQVFATIGGAIMEHDMLGISKNLFEYDKPVTMIKKLLYNKKPPNTQSGYF